MQPPAGQPELSIILDVIGPDDAALEPPSALGEHTAELLDWLDRS